MQKHKNQQTGLEPANYYEVIKQTCEKLRNIVSAVHSSMWTIGKTLSESMHELGIEKKPSETMRLHKFYEDIIQNLENEVSVTFLGDCVRFFERYPDLADRVQKTGLTATHYERLSHLPEDEAEKFEKKASNERWSVKQLREKAFPQRLELQLSETLENYTEFTNSLTSLESSMEKLSKSNLEALSKNQINGMARSLFIFLTHSLPKFAEFLSENGAKLDSDFKKYVEKFRR